MLSMHHFMSALIIFKLFKKQSFKKSFYWHVFNLKNCWRSLIKMKKRPNIVMSYNTSLRYTIAFVFVDRGRGGWLRKQSKPNHKNVIIFSCCIIIIYYIRGVYALFRKFYTLDNGVRNTTKQEPGKNNENTRDICENKKPGSALVFAVFCFVLNL